MTERRDDGAYGRPRDDRDDYRPRSRSRGRDRDSDRRRSPSPGRRSGDERRNDTRSPYYKDQRDWNERRSRDSSRSRSPIRRQKSSPSPPLSDSRYRRDYPPAQRHPSHYDSPHQGYRGRGGWTRGPSQYRGGYQGRPYDSPYRPGAEADPGHPSTPSSATSYEAGVPSATSAESLDPTGSAAPAGPASWRRAQQYKQERFQQDYRPNFPPARGGISSNGPQRTPSYPPQPSMSDPSISMSPTLHRIPTGPRALGSQSLTPARKEYISPVAEQDEQLAKLKADHEKLEAKDQEMQRRKRAALAEWTILDRESKREATKVEMTEKLLEATVTGIVA